MAIYSPPNGLLAKLDLAGAYSPPAGLLAKLDLHPPGIVIPTRRSLQKSAGEQWQTGQQQQVAAAGQWQAMRARSKAAGMQWQAAVLQSGAVGLPWRKLNALGSFARAGWQFALARQMSGVLPWQSMQALFSAARLDFAANELRVAVKKSSWQQSAAALRSFAMQWNSAHARSAAALLPWELGLLRWRDVDLRWDAARAVPYQHLPVVVIPPQPPHRCYIPPFGLAANINLAGDYMPPLGLQAGIGLGCKTIIQHWIRTISGRPLMHTISALVGGKSLVLLGLSLEHDIDGFLWSGRCSIDPQQNSLLDPVDGQPAEVLVKVDGDEWLMIAESRSRKRVFGEEVIDVVLAGVHALLGERYAAKRSVLPSDATTSLQLANMALHDSGFSLDWQLPSWLIPANVASIDNRPPVGWLADVAAAAGGVVLPVAGRRAFRAVYRYPYSPWDWGTAPVAAVLDESAIFTLSEVTEPHPPANAVFVSGRTGGVAVEVVRAGTAGDVWASSVIDALITESVAGRERGRRILCEAGNTQRISVECTWASALKIVGSLIQVGASGPRCMLTRVAISADRDGFVSCNIDLARKT